MLYGIACFRVNGVGVFFTIFIIKIPIVPTCCKSAVRKTKYCLYFIVGIERIVCRFCNTYFPWQTLIINALYDNFSTYFYHIGSDAPAVEESGNDVTAVSFCYGTAVKHYA